MNPQTPDAAIEPSTLAQISAVPRVAVVICAYTEKRWDVTLRAVASVQAQQPLPAELVVVIDNNPELQARFSEQLPGVKVVANLYETGVSGARNTGVELVTADVVVFLDDDAFGHPGWLAALARHYTDPQVLGVGGRIDPDWATRRPSWWPPEFDWVVGCSYTGQVAGKVRNLIGANASFRRELFASGGFLSGIGRSARIALPVGCEETEFCIRVAAKRPGGYFLYDDQAAVSHHVPVERQTFSYFRSRCWSEGLSKAQMTRSVGVEAGLASEWTYSTVTLPRGVLRNLGLALRGEPAGLARAAAIVIGLAYTTAGYVVGAVSRRLRERQAGAR